jgi:predicted polyphosphate/ATP-dependent NAD kinase
VILNGQPLVGIIANPASGKDIRRLVAHATTVDNQEKVSIIQRALVGLGAAGVTQVLVMPDSYHLGERALRDLRGSGPLPEVGILEMPVADAAIDSERAARLLAAAGAGCILVLGGDGTVRVASKGCGEVPLLPISTGTNNVLPTFVEGTVAGLAAGAVAAGLVALDAVSYRHKWLEVRGEGESRDRALVDAAVLHGRFLGARAVWQGDDIRQVVVTRAHPANIGISAVAGLVRPVSAEEPAGLALTLAPDARRRVRAALGPGLIVEVGVAGIRPLRLREAVALAAEEPLVVALDGEREVALHPGQRAAIVLRGDGPRIVSAPRVMERITVRRHFDHNSTEPERGSGII